MAQNCCAALQCFASKNRQTVEFLDCLPTASLPHFAIDCTRQSTQQSRVSWRPRRVAATPWDRSQSRVAGGIGSPMAPSRARPSLLWICVKLQAVILRGSSTDWLLVHGEDSVVALDTPDAVSYHHGEETPIICRTGGGRGVLRIRGTVDGYPIFAPLVFQGRSPAGPDPELGRPAHSYTGVRGLLRNLRKPVRRRSRGRCWSWCLRHRVEDVGRRQDQRVDHA